MTEFYAAIAELTRPPFRRTLASTMPSGFDEARPVAQLYGAFTRVKGLLHRPPRGAAFHALLRESETLLRSLTPAEIKIVEGATK
ncbi:MAG: hypothetical protein WAO21_13680 [Verrucomicrobiia bacterium]